MPTTKKEEEEAVKLTSILELDGGLAPKAQPEDTSELNQGNSETMALNPNSGEAGIQFIPAGAGAGGNDAKVELGAAAAVPAFVGLGKEELMKYANDPFWVRLRWILFILFWVVWLGMLVGAIVIIILAPKCSDLSKGMKIVEEKGPFYQVYLSKFSDNGKLTGLAAKADYLSKLGVRTIIISQPFETKAFNPDDGISEVTNFTKINPFFGTLDEFTNITQVFKAKNISVVLQVIPNHSSRDHPWFAEDAQEFYVLKPKVTVEGSKWKSFYEDSAWAVANESDPDGLRYLHQFRASEADLNYRSDKVVNMMNDVLKYWYNAGVDGFLLSDVSYLVEDLSKLSDPAAMLNNEDNTKIVTRLIDTKSWKIPEDGSRKQPFALLDYNGLLFADEVKCGRDFALPVLSDLQSVIPTNYSATDLEKHFGKEIGDKFVVRRLSGPRFQHLLNKYKDDRDRAHMLAMITFLVRGEVVVYNGDEFTFTDAQARAVSASGDRLDINRPTWSSFSVTDVRDYFQQLFDVHNLMKKNKDKDDDKTKFVADNGVFAFRRVTPDRTVIVVANVNREESETATVVDVAKLFGLDAKQQGVVKSVTPGFTPGLPIVGNVVQLNSINLPLRKAVAILEGSGDAPLKAN